MRRDELYLRDIVRTAGEVIAFIAEQSLETLVNDSI
jgi:hypothetical protein